MYLDILFVIIILTEKTLLLQIGYSDENSTSQGKTISENHSNLAIDGNINSCAISASNGDELAWWSVKLDRDYSVERVIIRYNSITEYSKYMNHFKVFVSKNPTNLEENICKSFKENRKNVPRFVTLDCELPITGNLVTIKRFGGVFKHWLVLCEVFIYANVDIISANKPTYTNSVFFRNTSDLLVDGSNDTCTDVIAKKGDFAWWQVFLEEKYYIDKVVIYFNPESSGLDTINNFIVYVSNEMNAFEEFICEESKDAIQNNQLNGVIDVPCKKAKPIGTYVTIKKSGGKHPRHLHGLCEVNVYTKKVNQFPVCLSNQATCMSLRKCIPQQKICDNVKHCPNGVDEIHCECRSHQYRCRGYDCITREWLCDGYKDCPQGDDEETGCDCPEGKFKCKQRQKCMDKDKQCDGVNDCPDHSDENNCFSFKDGYLLVTYKGITDYNVCSTKWDDIHSGQICNYISDSFSVSYSSFETDQKSYDPGKMKLVTLKNGEPFEFNSPNVARFDLSDSCPSKEVVRIDCSGGGAGRTSMCGTRTYPDSFFEPYIINGKMAKEGAWPWHVQVLYNGAYVCGGTLVRNNFVLTAAHCIKEHNERLISIKIGVFLFRDRNIPNHEISQIFKHPLFEEENGDIALIRLKKPVTFTNYIKPICLPNGIQESEIMRSFSYCVFTGFGDMDREFTSPPSLMQGRMNLMTDDECAKNVAELTFFSQEKVKNFITSKHFLCAGSIPTVYGVANCWGDSGGPLVCKDKSDVWTQIGVQSKVFRGKEIRNCTNSIFTNVVYHINFINEVLERDDHQTDESQSMNFKKCSTGIIPFIAAICFIFSYTKF